MPVQVNCTRCGKEIVRAPSDVHEQNFCNNSCRKRRIQRVCLCGKPFETIPGHIRGPNQGKFCSPECFGRWASQTRTGERNGFYGKAHTENTKKAIKLKSIQREAWLPLLTPEARQKQKEAVRRPANRARQAQRRAEANRTLIKPTKLEKNLETLLEREFPGEWEYTGTGKVIIDGMIPDFFNKNGRKIVIEAFGRYWHEEKARTWRRTELGRIMAYNALGIQCLVIWEGELADEQRLVEKIRTFTRAKAKNSSMDVA